MIFDPCMLSFARYTMTTELVDIFLLSCHLADRHQAFASLLNYLGGERCCYLITQQSIMHEIL